MRSTRRFRGAIGGGLLAGVLLTACVPPPPPPPPPPSLPGLGSACLASAPSDAATSNAAPGSRTPGSDEPLNPHEAGETVSDAVATNETRNEDGSIPLVLVEEDGGKPEVTTATASSTEHAEEIAADAAQSGALASVAVDSVVTAAATDDFFFPEQWSFDQTSFESAWATSTGAGTTVAVIDTGVQMDHPDLRDQVVTGRQFLYGEGLRNGRRFHGVDTNGHGTHVAGIIGAATNNDRGVAGTAPDTTIKPLRALEACGSGWSSDVALAIDYARRSGVDVINLSLGAPDESDAVHAEIQEAVADGVIVVVSAGNDGNGLDPAPEPWSYPAARDESVAVAAVELTGALTGAVIHASYSTTAPYVDVAAPGSRICSTWDIRKNFAHHGCRDGVTARYRYLQGTSMAAPHVSGAAALLKSVRPDCTAADFRALIAATSDPISGTTAPQVGAGMIDPAGILADATC